VTHDQEEALTMSDRLAVLSAGRVVQAGTPAEVYEEPRTEYVADFLGVSNVMGGEAVAGGPEGGCLVRVGDFELVAMHGATDARGAVRLVVRPERVLLEPFGTPGQNRIAGMIERLVYMGPTTQVVVRLAPGDPLQAMVANQGQELGYRQGMPVSVHIPPDALRVLATSSPPAPDRERG